MICYLSSQMIGAGYKERYKKDIFNEKKTEHIIISLHIVIQSAQNIHVMLSYAKTIQQQKTIRNNTCL